MCSSVTLSDLELWVENMMKNLNLNDYKLDVAGNSIKGDGYLGEVTFVTVKTPQKNYELVVKSAKKSEELRKQTPVKEAYDREIFFYNRIIPILVEFQRQKSIEPVFAKFAKCYSVTNETMREAIILQNLKSVGYELHDRTKPMNLSHVETVFFNYGRFHALSLALRHQKPAFFKNITKNMTDIMAKFTIQSNMLQTFHKEFEYLKKLLDKNGHQEVLEKLQGFDEEFEEVLCTMSDENCSPAVITHGDCWNNNFMFKYDETDKTKPKDMCFLDFQLSRVASPIIDLSYFLYSVSDKEVLKHFDAILQTYHSSLSTFLRQLGTDPEKVVSFNGLREQWAKYGRFGLVMSLIILKIELCDSDEAPDLTESAEKGQVMDNFLDITIKDQDIYDQRIQDVYLHFVKDFM